MINVGRNGISTLARNGRIGCRKKLACFCAGERVSNAPTYAPIAAKPA